MGNHRGNWEGDVYAWLWPFRGKNTRARDAAFRARWKGAGFELAEAIAALGGDRYPAVWDLSPRQMAAYLFLHGERDRAKAARELSISALGSRGDVRQVTEQIDEWSGE